MNISIQKKKKKKLRKFCQNKEATTRKQIVEK